MPSVVFEDPQADDLCRRVARRPLACRRGHAQQHEEAALDLTCHDIAAATFVRETRCTTARSDVLSQMVSIRRTAGFVAARDANASSGTDGFSPKIACRITTAVAVTIRQTGSAEANGGDEQVAGGCDSSQWPLGWAGDGDRSTPLVACVLLMPHELNRERRPSSQTALAVFRFSNPAPTPPFKLTRMRPSGRGTRYPCADFDQCPGMAAVALLATRSALRPVRQGSRNRLATGFAVTMRAAGGYKTVLRRIVRGGCSRRRCYSPRNLIRQPAGLAKKFHTAGGGAGNQRLQMVRFPHLGQLRQCIRGRRVRNRKARVASIPRPLLLLLSKAATSCAVNCMSVSSNVTSIPPPAAKAVVDAGCLQQLCRSTLATGSSARLRKPGFRFGRDRRVAGVRIPSTAPASCPNCPCSKTVTATACPANSYAIEKGRSPQTRRQQSR